MFLCKDVILKDYITRSIGEKIMFELLSNRLKNKNGEPEVYIYDDFVKEFRNQVFYIISDVLNPYVENDHSDLWEFIHDGFAREKGLKKLGNYEVAWNDYGEHNIEYYLDNSSSEYLLDFIDFTFNVFDKVLREVKPQYSYNYNSNENVNKAIIELNYRFKQHSLGYEFVNGEIIRIDNKIIHHSVIKPALKLLYDENFSGAEEEIRKAFEYKRKSDNKNAILEAGKAFESTMKTICDLKGYTYDKAKDTAQKLINILESNHFYPAYMSTHLTNLRTTLETGLPVVRNKNAGHGQGSLVVNIPDEFAEYALNLAATNIVLLVNIFKITK